MTNGDKFIILFIVFLILLGLSSIPFHQSSHGVDGSGGSESGVSMIGINSSVHTTPFTSSNSSTYSGGRSDAPLSGVSSESVDGVSSTVDDVNSVNGGE